MTAVENGLHFVLGLPAFSTYPRGYASGADFTSGLVGKPF
jgi:hypothetical protein